MKAIEILELVKEKLIEQGAPSMSGYDLAEGNGCAYTAADGKKHCGIGWLVPDGPFEEGMGVVNEDSLEGRSPNDNTRVLLDAGIISQAQYSNQEFLEFLDEVQSAHDHAGSDNFATNVRIGLAELIPLAYKLDEEIPS